MTSDAGANMVDALILLLIVVGVVAVAEAMGQSVLGMYQSLADLL